MFLRLQLKSHNMHETSKGVLAAAGLIGNAATVQVAVAHRFMQRVTGRMQVGGLLVPFRGGCEITERGRTPQRLELVFTNCVGSFTS
jgi:hypothetical protein